MIRAKSRRWNWAVCLMAVLMGSSWGCQPASSGTGTGSAPATSKPDKQPDNKDKPAKPPSPDVG